MSLSKHAILNEGLPLWTRLQDLDPDAKSLTYGQWQAAETAQAISDALDLEPTELTAQLLLGYFLRNYEAATTYSLHDLLHNASVFETKAALCRDIEALLGREDLVLDRLDFVDQMERALAHYGVADREEVQEVLADDSAMAILRRDALRSHQKMATTQFLQGAVGPATRPGYSTVIRQWWNLNSLLEAALTLPEGVSLHLIRTPSEFESYFVFMVRRGANLYAVNDAPQHAHPLQGRMARRPDRDMDRRISKNWFPYSLMGMKFDEEDGRMYFDQAVGTALVPGGVPFQGQTTVLKHLSDMPPCELIWTILMFDLLMDRFWVKELPQLPMGYTGQMLKQEGALRLTAEKVGLPVVPHALGTVAVPELTLHDLQTMHESPEAEAALGTIQPHPFAWLEARYADQVPVEAFNLVAGERAQITLEQGEVKVALAKTKADSAFRGFDREDGVRTVTLDALPPTHFGTAAQLKADRAFLARHNYARVIDAAAQQEFKARKNEVMAWYHARMAERVPFLTGLLGHGELWVEDTDTGNTFNHMGSHAGKVRVSARRSEKSRQDTVPHIHEAGGMSHTLMHTYRIGDKNEFEELYSVLGAHHLGPSGWREGRTVPLCIHYETAISAHVLFCPTNSAELAFLLGLPVTELPDVLQHLTKFEPYRGNSILQRIDPVLWALNNPWAEQDYRVRLGLSKRGLKKAAQAVDPVDLTPLFGLNARLARGESIAP